MLRNLNQSSAGRRILGTPKTGVLAENIPEFGDDGAGYAFKSLSFPADNGKEICGTITTWPSAGKLVAYEDTSFEFSDAPDDLYWFEWQLKVGMVPVGDPVRVDLRVGTVTHTATGALASGAASVSGSATRSVGFVTHTASGALVAVTATVSGSAVRTGAATVHTASGALSALSASVIGSAIRTGVATTHDASGNLVSVSATVSGVATRAAGTFTGSLSDADIARIAAAVLAALQATAIPVNTVQINSKPLTGSGTPADPMRPA